MGHVIVPEKSIKSVDSSHVGVIDPNDEHRLIDNKLEQEIEWKSPKLRIQRDFSNYGSRGTGGIRTPLGSNQEADMFDTSQPLPPIR